MLLLLQNTFVESKPRQAFLSYSHRQEPWKERLLKTLRPLEEQRQIAAWNDRKLLPGHPWDGVIREELDRADIVLLLVSPDFVSSSYCRDVEVRRAVERASVGEAILIPVIIEKCEWQSEPFARFQSLPIDGSPIAEKSDVEAVLHDCREKIALACVGQWFPRRPRGEDANRGMWRLTVRASWPPPDWPQLVRRLRAFTREPDICFHGAAAPSADASKPDATVQVLFLDGSPKAFVCLEEAQKAGRLSAELGLEVLKLELVLGATVLAGTYLADEVSRKGNNSVQLLKPSKPYTPPLVLGIGVRPSDPSWFMTLPFKGNSTLEGEALAKEYQLVTGYFFTALALPGEEMHVNLSIHEEGRILPRSLASAPLGRVLVEQDCLLKHFAASLLHPDTPTGQEFWPRVLDLAKQTGLSDQLQLKTCQKAWIVAGSATIQQKDPGKPFPFPIPPRYDIRLDDFGAVVSECRMKLMCETDYASLQNSTTQRRDSVNENGSAAFHEGFVQVFKDVVLPAIETEVNEGSLFAQLRQAYYGVALAKWYHEVLAEPGIHTSLLELSGKMRQELLGGSASDAASEEIGSGPNAPAWLNECFERYVRLYKDGVFECLRMEPSRGSISRARVFFSGGFDLNFRHPFTRREIQPGRCIEGSVTKLKSGN